MIDDIKLLLNGIYGKQSYLSLVGKVTIGVVVLPIVILAIVARIVVAVCLKEE